MEIVQFKNVRDTLINNMRRNMLIPVIGSGFTRGCKSNNGIVPSGEDYRQHMIERIISSLTLSSDEIGLLKNDSFANVSSIYHKVVSIPEQKMFLQNRFTKVRIENDKKKFLSLPWPYIYTLNIDDGIEYSSDYKHIIYSNRHVNKHIFDEYPCTIKLHGDVAEMLTYEDSNSEIFTQEQYVSSLKKNISLLNKLRHDSLFLNLLFIGCSLDEEIDLLAYLTNDDGDGTKNITSKYYCKTKEPNVLEKMKYEKYGITHCVVFDSYESMYNDIYEAGLDAQEICFDDLEDYKSFSIKELSAAYNENKPYLLFGKSLISKEHIVQMPYFFIRRTQTEKIVQNLTKFTLQMMVGNGCSGKSYILADIACRIRDKDVFLFETKDRLSDDSFDALIGYKDCVILADNSFFTSLQIEYILENLGSFKKNNVRIVLSVNKNDRDLFGILKRLEFTDIIHTKDIPKVEISNKFNEDELNLLNPRLTAVTVGIFNGKKTIVDNIIELSNSLIEKNKYQNINPCLTEIRHIAALIALATERKIYSSRAIELDILEELVTQKNVSKPLIDSEVTWSFERSAGDISPIKYVVNAEYWLCEQLKQFAKDRKNNLIIVEAYKYIITKILEERGRPNLLNSNKNASYKNYILFDNINKIFFDSKSGGSNGLILIKLIYESLNDLLSTDPNYMHQRAKCYIKLAYYENDDKEKNLYFDKAYRDTNVASQVFLERFKECGNDKLLISIAHITYTQALIKCHKCYINKYQDIEDNTNAIRTVYEALKSPYNTYEFAKSDSFNYGNVIKKMVTDSIANKSLVREEVYTVLEELFQLLQ